MTRRRVWGMLAPLGLWLVIVFILWLMQWVWISGAEEVVLVSSGTAPLQPAKKCRTCSSSDSSSSSSSRPCACSARHTPLLDTLCVLSAPSTLHPASPRASTEASGFSFTMLAPATLATVDRRAPALGRAGQGRTLVPSRSRRTGRCAHGCNALASPLRPWCRADCGGSRGAHFRGGQQRAGVRGRLAAGVGLGTGTGCSTCGAAGGGAVTHTAF